jgi:hypothetical protein
MLAANGSASARSPPAEALPRSRSGWRLTDSNTSTVSVSLTCGTGNVAVTPKNASDNPDTPAVFTVTGIPVAGTTCTATEGTAPVGYTKNESDCLNKALAATGSSSCTMSTR